MLLRGGGGAMTHENTARAAPRALDLVLVNSSLTGGGSERAMTLLANALARRGHRVTMLLVRRKARTYQLDESVDLIELDNNGPRWLKLWRRLRDIRAQVRRVKPDAVVAFMWDINVTTLLATLGLGTAVIVSERNMPNAGIRPRWSRLAESVTYRAAHRIVYQTEQARTTCPSHAAARSVVIPNMIQVLDVTADGTAGTSTIVAAGRLTRQKNHALLVRAFARFADAHPGWTLRIFGQGPLQGELEDLARSLGVADLVEFPGYVSDLPDQVRSAGMFVLSSDFEGIPNALAEAMAVGTPVVSTDCPVGGPALLIDQQVTGLLVPVGDEHALAAAMSTIADDPARAQAMARAAQQSVARFAPDVLVAQWERLVPA